MKSKLKMKRAGRKRRAAGWTLLALGLLVAGLWVASRNTWSGGIIAGTSFDVENGAVLFYRPPVLDRWVFLEPQPEADRGWRFVRVEHSVGATTWLKLGVLSYEREGSGASLLVMLWPVPILLWTPAALLLRSGIVARRRAIAGLCKKCGYSLAGLPAGSPCPECGKGAVTA